MKLPTSSMMGPKSRIMVTVKVSSDCEDGFDDDEGHYLSLKSVLSYKYLGT